MSLVNDEHRWTFFGIRIKLYASLASQAVLYYVFVFAKGRGIMKKRKYMTSALKKGHTICIFVLCFNHQNTKNPLQQPCTWWHTYNCQHINSVTLRPHGRVVCLNVFRNSPAITLSTNNRITLCIHCVPLPTTLPEKFTTSCVFSLIIQSYVIQGKASLHVTITVSFMS